MYQCGAPCTIHERFTQDSPAARNHAGEGEEGRGGIERVASFHGFRVVCVQRWAGLPYRCNGSKQIILANENAGLPALVNVYDYEDSRAKRDCCHLSRFEARSIPRNYVGLTAGKISWDNFGLKLSFVIENYTETINI